MRSDNNSPVRTLVHDVTGPLGWSLNLMAEAAECSVATVKNDLRARGGVTGAYPNRPQTQSGIYAATFERWLEDGGFLNDVVRKVAEGLLEMPRILSTADGLEQAYEALCVPVVMPDDLPCMNLLSTVFGFNILQARATAPQLWTAYVQGVKKGELALPHSTNDALKAVTDFYRTQIDRTAISVLDTSRVRKMVEEAIMKLDGRGRMILVRRYGLTSGSSPETHTALANELGVSPARIMQIEGKAVDFLRRSGVKHLLERLVPWTLGDLIDRNRALCVEVDSLRVQIEGLVGVNQEWSRAIVSGNPMTLLLTQVEANALTQLSRRVEEFDLSVRSANCLQNAGVEYIWQLVEKTEGDLLRRTKNFGRKSLNEIKEVLKGRGLRLGMTISPIVRTALPGYRLT